MIRAPRDLELSSSALSAISEVTISLAFSSTSVVAIGLNRPGIYFEPRRRYTNSFYESKFSKVVAYDPIELRAVVEYWLNMDFKQRAEQMGKLFSDEGWLADSVENIRFKIGTAFTKN